MPRDGCAADVVPRGRCREEEALSKVAGLLVSRVAPSPPRIVSDFSERNWTFPKKIVRLIASRHVQIRSCAGLPSKFFGTNRDPAPRLDSSGSGERKPDRASQHVVEVVCHLRREGPGREVRARRHQARREESGTLHVPRAGKDGGSEGVRWRGVPRCPPHGVGLRPRTPYLPDLSPSPSPAHPHTRSLSLSRARSRVSVVLTRASHPNFRLLSARRQGFR